MEKAAEKINDLRIAGVDRLDVTVQDGRVALFRARVTVSFKYATSNIPDYLAYDVQEGPPEY